MKSLQQFLRVVVAASLALAALATPAQADILLEFDDLISGAEGWVRTVAEAEVPADLVGRTCQVAVLAENQASVHPGNDLIISTGDSQAVIVGIEDEVNGGVNETYQLVVGSTITVQLRFGPDELSSLGFDLSFDCDLPATTTTTPSLDGQQVTGATSSTTIPATTVTTAGCAATVPNAAAIADGSTIDGSTPVTTVVSSLVEASTGCPDAINIPADPTTTTSTTPVTVSPATSSIATDALPPSPVATAIVAAPAYAG